MAGDDSVRAGVRQFILDTFLVGEPPETLKDSTALLTTGIVSSLATLELVAFLENEFSVTLQPDDLSPDRLDSIDRIVALVEARRAPDSI